MQKTGKIILVVAIIVAAIAIIGVGVIRFLNSSLSPATGRGGYEAAGVVASESVALGMRDSVFAGVTKAFAPQQAGAPASAPAPSPSAPELPGGVDRLIIKTGQFSLVVKDVREAVEKITEYAVSKGGFVVSSNIYKSGLAPRADVAVRIPVKEFDAGIDETKKLGEVASESVNGQDVTEEYVDLDAQVRNLRATEEQLMAIMRRSGTIPDVLAVQRELTEVRREVERMQGRIKYLTQSAELSTLTVHLSTDPEELPVFEEDKDTWKPFAVLKNAARSLLKVGKVLVNVFIWLVVYIPLWLVIIFSVWLMIKIVKRVKRKNIGGP